MLKQVTENVWEAVDRLKVPMVRMDHRMTVVRLAGGELLVHSPIAYSRSLAEGIKTLGKVKWLVAPSRFHDMYWPEWFSAFPGATFAAAPGVREAHPELPFTVELRKGLQLWDGELVAMPLLGMPKINEYVMLHTPSRSLIAADLVFNFDPAAQNFTGKLFLRLNGIYGKPGISRIFRRFIKDRRAFVESVREIQSKQFERMIIGHGADPGGSKALAEMILDAGFEDGRK
jgi:hypothetical protein